MRSLGRGDLDAAHASVNIVPVKPNSRDELGEMADSFNVLQDRVKEAALGLDEARENMRTARTELLARHEQIAHLAHHDPLTDLPNRTLLAAAPGRRVGQAKAANRCSRCSASTSITSRRSTTCSGTASATSCCARLRGGCEAAAEDAFVARVGGDEFTFVGRRRDSRRRSDARRRGCCKRWPSDFEIRGQQIAIGLSIGVAIYPRDGADATTLLGQRRRGALSRQGRRPRH